MTIIEKLLKRKENKFSTEVKVPDTNFSFPMTVIRNGDTPKTLVQAGLHSAEFVGIETALELIDSIKPEEISGVLFIIPLLNTSGFFKRTMSLVSEDLKNLNRVFPGSVGGTVSEKVAHFLEHEIYSDLDYLIDLHSGDCFERLDEFVYTQGNAPEKVKAVSEKMALAVDVPFTVSTQSDTGGAYNYAAQMGLPAVLIERGCLGLWSQQEVKKTAEDVINILKTIGMISGESKVHLKPLYSEAVYEHSDTDGLWYPVFKVGENFEAGETLGTVKNLSGEILQTVRAESSGFILYETVSLNVLKGDPLVAYAKL